MSTSSLPSFLKIHQVVLEKKLKMWKFTDDDDGRTDDGRCAMTIAHLSHRLRWAKNRMKITWYSCRIFCWLDGLFSCSMPFQTDWNLSIGMTVSVHWNISTRASCNTAYWSCTKGKGETDKSGNFSYMTSFLFYRCVSLSLTPIKYIHSLHYLNQKYQNNIKNHCSYIIFQTVILPCDFTEREY